MRQLTLVIVSADADVLAVCRELVAEFSDVEWLVSLQNETESVHNADLCIWDAKPGRNLPCDVDWGSRHFVLVRRKDLTPFRAAHPQAAASVILKPITRSVLRAVFSQAIALQKNRPSPPAANGHASSVRGDRDALLQCLIEANLRLQEYDHARTNFLTRAVHDFRAPLTAITGYCGLLIEENVGPLNQEQQEIIRRMNHSGRRLARMANAMFQLSVGRRVDTQPTLRPANIRDAVEQALHEVSQFAEEKRIEVSVDLLPCSGTLCFDASQIEQALMNLLDNACKFTPRFGSVEIRGYPYFWERRLPNVAFDHVSNRREQQVWLPNSYRIDVCDSGPGIPPDHLHAIFEEYTLYPANQDRSGGGLGLAICKMIVAQHRGRIWAENSAQGAVFSIVLPFHAANHDREGAQQQARSVVG